MVGAFVGKTLGELEGLAERVISTVVPE